MKSVLITGASSGFGRNVAVAMAELGWHVFASMRRVDKGQPMVADAALLENGRVDLIEMDVTSQESIDLAVAQVLSMTGGKIDALFNNAGYSILGAFEDMDESHWRAQMNTNFFGTLAVTKAVLPAMRQAESGRILVTSSNAANTPHPMLSLYAASKWALEGWAEALAMEVAPFGITVALAQPGAHRTPFASNVIPVMHADSAYAEWLAQAMPGVAKLDEWGRSADAATATLVELLTTDQPSFRTALGGDTEIFSGLKSSYPYELRAAILSAIVDLPRPNAFIKRPVPALPMAPAVDALLDAVAQSQELRATLADIIARTAAGRQ